ncbi:MAG: hypothetical protein HXY52_04945 [Nitrospirae bacterium]|jgi:hypothetical protein|nr:hypothetical protein [Nitrospirota bacterium]
MENIFKLLQEFVPSSDIAELSKGDDRLTEAVKEALKMIEDGRYNASIAFYNF